MKQSSKPPVDLRQARLREMADARVRGDEDAIADLSMMVSEDGIDLGDAIAELSQLVSDLLGGE